MGLHARNSDLEAAQLQGTVRGGPRGAGANAPTRSGLWRTENLRAASYGLLNIVTASGIVFANKYVFANCHFKFTYALTWIHTVFTLLGMSIFCRFGLFESKRLPVRKLMPLAAAYVAYIVLCNLSLNINTVGFYQVMKIAVAPTVIALEFAMFGRLPGLRIMASVLLVCAGIAVATVTDSQVVRNLMGVGVGVGATVMTALYQIWAGTKQKELKASSMQLLHAYTPQSALMLGILVPLLEPMGWSHASLFSHTPVMPPPITQEGVTAGGTIPGVLGFAPGAQSGAPDGTLLGFQFTAGSALAILISSALGLGVSLSTFLVIGATSSLTYNVVGHLKTLIILTGGCLYFGDTMPLKKLVGVGIAMAGIVWYTQLKLSQAAAAPASSAGALQAAAGGGAGGAAGHAHSNGSALHPASGVAAAGTGSGTGKHGLGQQGEAAASAAHRSVVEEGLSNRSAFTTMTRGTRNKSGHSA